MTYGEMLMDGHFLGGPCDQATPKEVIRSPWDDTVVGTAAEGGWSELDGCLQAARDAFPAWRRTSRTERAALLARVGDSLAERRDELAELVCREVGKPIIFAQAEVDRCILTFRLAADLAVSFGSETLPTDFDPRGAGATLRVERFAMGPVLGFVPYNWPLNLAAHKLAPALACGAPIVLKPSPLAPIATMELVRLVHGCGAPPGVVNVWNGPNEAAARAVRDPRVAVFSFTGSARVGWDLRAASAARTTLLELGGDASVFLHRDADLDLAIPKVVASGYGYAGQVCIAAQHVRAHHEVFAEVRERLITTTAEFPTGRQRDVLCGPLLNDDAASKVEAWVQEAVAAGAKVLAGGRREGRLMWPTLVEDVPPGTRLANEEVFGPVLTLSSYGSIEEGITRGNAGPYGLQAGLFTRSEEVVEAFFQELEVGGLVVNDAPSLRFDNMPYGGWKRSGLGREGVRYAMEAMTEPRVLVNRPL